MVSPPSLSLVLQDDGFQVRFRQIIKKHRQAVNVPETVYVAYLIFSVLNLTTINAKFKKFVPLPFLCSPFLNFSNHLICAGNPVCFYCTKNGFTFYHHLLSS